jgi:hypothetical protein
MHTAKQFEIKKGKGVYIGAGVDNDILDLNIELLIAIDSRPEDECPDPRYPTSFKCVRPRFLEELVYSYSLKGFVFKSENVINNCLTFKNKSRIIRYYHSVVFPNELSKFIQDDIHEYQFLICIGYMPHKCILDYSSSFQFIGSNYTCYLYPQSDILKLTDQVDWNLLKDSSKIKSWLILVQTDLGKIIDQRLLYGIEDYRIFAMHNNKTIIR